jgi:hypothetical protein
MYMAGEKNEISSPSPRVEGGRGKVATRRH